MKQRQHTGSAVEIDETENVGSTAFGRVLQSACAQGWRYWRIASHGWISHGRGDRNEGGGDDGRETHFECFDDDCGLLDNSSLRFDL